MKTLKLTAIICAATLSGCATCRNHPLVCAVAGAAVVGIAATAAAGGFSGTPRRATVPQNKQCAYTTGVLLFPGSTQKACY